MNTIPIKEYLHRKNIPFREKTGELIAKCVFNACDQDSKGQAGHLYFNSETSQYNCKKCGTQGNIFTLAEFLGDSKKDLLPSPAAKKSKKPDLNITVEQCHKNLPERIRQYLNQRGIPDDLINKHRLGWGNFYSKEWIVIPVRDIAGNILYLKLRRDPGTEIDPKMCFYPSGYKASLFGLETIKQTPEYAVICEGEFDCLVLHAQGIPAVTSTAGALTFKEEWIGQLGGINKLYVCFDRDEAGQEGAQQVIEKIKTVFPKINLYKIEFPVEMTAGKDVTDYFTGYQGNAQDFLQKLPVLVQGRKPIDVSNFKELNANAVIEILGRTIKQDDENKLTTFLCMLSAFTEDAQFNISFNAPSSTGKSYIPLEIVKLFPSEDLIILGHCSPTAFFHDAGNYDRNKKAYIIDLSRKILIFIDQPHTQLLERLRPILSHDQKEFEAKITDKTQKHGMRAKKVIIYGYPAVVFCSAGMKIDEQEATRFILLSPQTSQEKLRAGIQEKLKRETDAQKYQAELENDPARQALKDRILAIKDAKIQNVIIKDTDLLEKTFFDGKPLLKPRHQRDIGRFISLVKAFTLLNLWFRRQEDNMLIATEKDIQEAAKLWNIISESQEHNLPPFIYSVFKDIILPLTRQVDDENNGICNRGVERQEIKNKYYKIHQRPLTDWQLRQDILPMLEMAELIYQEADPTNRRSKLIFVSQNI